MATKERYQNPVPDDTVILRLFVYNQNSFSNDPDMFYRFELDNDDKDYELCIYLNRISDKGGFYTFENNLIGGSDYVPKNDIEDIHNFAEVIANYSRKVLDEFEKGR